MVSCSLLEYLALKAKCEYLSDLRFIHVEERWLRGFILRSRDDFTPDEWKEAIRTILYHWTDRKERPGMNHGTDMNYRTDRNYRTDKQGNM